MRISDWSSDVCSSDLRDANLAVGGGHRFRRQSGIFALDVEIADLAKARDPLVERRPMRHAAAIDIVGQMIDQLHPRTDRVAIDAVLRSEEHTSELQSLMRISYAVFCLKKNTQNKIQYTMTYTTTKPNTIKT